jgi:glycosyltransferase involved in cell wall biosynthesis
MQGGTPGHGGNAPVSVLIATFNRGPLLGQALDSILAQRPAPQQVIVCDDGSSDDTAERMRRYPGVTYLRQENAGKSVALNRAMPHATGDYVWIFDDDDVALPGFLAAATERLAREPALGFVYAPHLLGDTDASGAIVSTRPHRFHALAGDDAFFKLLGTWFFHQGGMLVRRRCYDVVGPFNTALHRSQDYEMMLRLARAFECAPLAEPAFVLRLHAGPRGPRMARHGGSGQDRSLVHLKFDGEVGRYLRRTLALAEYVRGPRTSAPLAGDEQRLALLRRMGVMASKGLLTEMTEDLGAAFALDGHGDMPPSAIEQKACRDAVRHPYYWMQLARERRSYLARLDRLPRTPLRRQLLLAMAKGAASSAISAETFSDRAVRALHAVALARRAWL